MSVKPERLGDIDRAASAASTTDAVAAAVVNEVEGEIREFVRRDVSVFRRQRTDVSGGDPAENINSLIQRVSAQSLLEVERVINELSNVRDMLRSEGDRVQREISGYAALSQNAMTSMKIIAESLGQWQPPSAPQIRRSGT